ncbi:ABC transporter ATP-binding protein [Corynebacterium sp. UBA2622]|uniref:ABC transporter ATP-binding protein n=1 Tax=Corynebacterium sp. UBA2622 TaxID=1946393 RepID=UPI0025B7BC90|nr:ABC transporter ATP-binding protein [Corynebacterium sp. UBA2622]
MTNPPLRALDVRDLEVGRKGTPVLRGLNCTLEPGTITGLIGPSGCGKSTFMRAIMGVQRITGGSISVLGRPAGDPELRQEVAFTSQSLSIYREISVLDNVRYFGRLVGAGEDEARLACERVQLGDYLDRPVSQLSGGQAGRASLACALVGNPRFLVLDEPTVGLDPLTRAALWDLFRNLSGGGVTLLISSHVMDEALRCGSTLVMREGRFLAHEPITETMRRTGTATPEEALVALIKEDQ